MKLYRTASLFATPFISFYLHKRKAAGKEDKERFQERFGHASRPRPEGIVVWVHAASVGESISVLPLINRLSQSYPRAHILLTTGTTSSATLLKTRLPANAFHQFIPVDSLLAVKRFVKHWRPDAALWVESEFWPNLVTETTKIAPVVLINARVSDRSFTRWQRYRSFIQPLLQSFALCLPQSQEDGRRLEVLGAPHVTFIGNLKYDAPALPADATLIENIRMMIGQRPCWVAASTHPGEEEILCNTHQTLKSRYPNLLTIIIPRHATRGGDVAAIVTAKNLHPAQRSKGDAIQSDTDIYIADTMGELGIFYRLNSIVFIGGSLIPHGGQNPLEAARLECAIISGPHMENFREITRELLENDAMIQLSHNNQLEETVSSLLQDTAKRDILCANALRVAVSKSDILERYLEAISTYIHPS